MSRLPIKPGVFVQNVRIQPQSIEGVSTSNAAFLGETQTGPVAPTLVTSFIEYQRLFGGYFGVDKYLPYSVEGFFGNGGKRCYVCSVNDGNYASALAKLEAVDASIIYSPNAQATAGLATALIGHCERLRNRFAIFDSLKGQDPSSVTKPGDSSFAALYYPWIYVKEAETGPGAFGSARRTNSRNLRSHRYRIRCSQSTCKSVGQGRSGLGVNNEIVPTRQPHTAGNKQYPKLRRPGPTCVGCPNTIKRPRMEVRDCPQINDLS